MIEHQPTEKMWSNVLTKPKQGAGFRQDRAVLMNVEEDYNENDEKEQALAPATMLPLAEGLVEAHPSPNRTT